MLEALSHLPPAHQAYLIMVVIALCAFGLALGTVSTWTNLKK